MSLADLSSAEITALGAAAGQFGESPEAFEGRLLGRRVGLVFIAPSTRTRTSFWSAATTLGAHVLHLGTDDLQVTTGETWSDTGMVLSHYLDVVVARTNGPQRDLVELATQLPGTINALTEEEHPTQAIADLCAMQEHFGRVEGLRLVYVGHVNNTARSLAHLACKLPFGGLDVYSPEGEGFPEAEVAALNDIRGQEVVRQHHAIPESPPEADVIYTTRWQSMSAAIDDPAWLARFTPYAVTGQLVKQFSGATPPVVMHDLPAVRGQEVTSDVLDGVTATSLVPRQAFHKASAAAAALLWSTGSLR